MNHPAESAPGAAALSPRMQLRTATQPQHARLEALLRLGASDLSRAEYVAALRRFYPIYARLEAALERFREPLAKGGWDWPQRRKLPRLEADLRALEEPLPTRAITFSLDSPSAAWGCLYVIEGATLGGQHIVRVAQRLALTPEHGAAFFAGYGRDTGKFWRAFCASLDRALRDDPAACAAAVDAACRTFDLFASDEGLAAEGAQAP